MLQFWPRFSLRPLIIVAAVALTACSNARSDTASDAASERAADGTDDSLKQGSVTTDPPLVITEAADTSDAKVAAVGPAAEQAEGSSGKDTSPTTRAPSEFSDHDPDLTGINVDHWEFYTYDGVSRETSPRKLDPSEADISLAKWLEKRLIAFYENRPDLLDQIRDPANPISFQLFVNPEGERLTDDMDNWGICEYQDDPTVIAFASGMERFMPTQLPESKMFFYMSSCFEDIEDQSYHPTKGNFYKVDGTIPELSAEQQARMDELRAQIRTMVEENDPALLNLYSDDINFPSDNEYDDGYGFLSMTAVYYMEFKDYPSQLEKQHPAVQEAIALMDVVYGEQ